LSLAEKIVKVDLATVSQVFAKFFGERIKDAV
jgi:hypothetical protein